MSTEAQLKAISNSELASGNQIPALKHRTVNNAIIEEMYDAQSRADVLAGVQTAVSIASGDQVLVIRSGQAYLLDSSEFGFVDALADLTDVSIPTPSNDQVLAYNTSTSKWEAKDVNNLTSVVNISGTATTNALTKFTGINSIGNSILSDDGTTVTIAGDLSVNNDLTVGTINSGTSSDFVKGNGTLDSTTYQDTTEKGQANGYTPLDSGAKVAEAYLPDSILGQVSYQGTWAASTNTPTLANPPASTTKGEYYVSSDDGTQFGIDFKTGDWIISNGTAWEKVDNTDAVTSVFGRLGNVVANSGDYASFYPPVSRTISAGTGLTGGGDLSANRTISHANTSSQGSVNNSGGTVIQDVTLDGFGHVTGLASIDLDGRYVQSLTDTLDSVTDRGATTTNAITVGGATINGTALIQATGNDLITLRSLTTNSFPRILLDNNSLGGFSIVGDYGGANHLSIRNEANNRVIRFYEDSIVNEVNTTINGTLDVSGLITADDGVSVDVANGDLRLISDGTGRGALRFLNNTTEEARFIIESNGDVNLDMLLGNTFIVTGNLAVDTDTLFVDAGANRVGIGTSSPSVALDVVGDAEINGDLTLSDGSDREIFIGSSVANESYKIDVQTDQLFFEYESPGFPGFYDWFLKFRPSTETIDLSGTTSVTGNFLVGGDVTVLGGGDFAVDTDTLFVDASTGRVGIQNSSPSVALDVVGDAEINGTLDVIGDFKITKTDNPQHTLYNSNTTVLDTDILGQIKFESADDGDYVHTLIEAVAFDNFATGNKPSFLRFDVTAPSTETLTTAAVIEHNLFTVSGGITALGDAEISGTINGQTISTGSSAAVASGTWINTVAAVDGNIYEIYGKTEVTTSNDRYYSQVMIYNSGTVQGLGIVSSTNMEFQVSGGNLQLRQTTGSARDIIWTVIKRN